MINTSLYKLSNELMALMDEVAAADGEMTPEMETKLAQLETSLTGKTEGVVHWVRYNEDLIQLAKSRISELTDMVRTIETRLSNFDRYVDSSLTRLGKTKLEAPLAVITKAKPRQVVEVYDEGALPPEFTKSKVTTTIDKTALGKVLKEGEEVPGAHLVESTTISISYKLR